MTSSTMNGGYLNFMGNEFGHPEWIDFPREGNNWSYHYARRQWSLVDSPKLKYKWLGAFDTAMLAVVRHLHSSPGYVTPHDTNHTLSFERDGLIFAFNFSPTTSYTEFAVPAPEGSYRIVLDSDDSVFGGQGRVDHEQPYLSRSTDSGTMLSLYLPARTALVLKPTNS